MVERVDRIVRDAAVLAIAYKVITTTTCVGDCLMWVNYQCDGRETLLIGAGRVCLGGDAHVAVMQATHFWCCHNVTGGRPLDSPRHRAVLREREVRTETRVVGNVAPQHPAQAGLTQDDHVIKALATDRADDARVTGARTGECAGAGRGRTRRIEPIGVRR